MKKYLPVNSNQTRAGVALLTSDQMVFNTKIVTRDKERIFYNDKRVNATRKYNNYIHIHNN